MFKTHPHTLVLVHSFKMRNKLSRILGTVVSGSNPEFKPLTWSPAVCLFSILIWRETDALREKKTINMNMLLIWVDKYARWSILLLFTTLFYYFMKIKKSINIPFKDLPIHSISVLTLGSQKKKYWNHLNEVKSNIILIYK